MAINRLIVSIALGLVTILFISCGGGGYGGGGGGLYNSGTTATASVARGTIDGFGSIFVNGVEFETGGAMVYLDDNLSSDDALRLGMVVTVNGSVGANGISGNATSVIFDDDVQGPIGAITLSVDGESQTLVVLGVTIVVDRNTTVFSNVTFDTLAINDVVEVSGSFDNQNQLIATRIERKENFVAGVSEVELKGAVTGLSGTTFSIGGISVDFSSADLSAVPGGVLVDGLGVEVKGTLTGTNISATRIKREDDPFGGVNNLGTKVSVEGVITNFISKQNFTLLGISVDASSASLEPSTLVLADNVFVEAEGAIVNGKLLASKIEVKGGELRLGARVQSVNASTREIVLIYTSGNSVTVKISSKTTLDDSTGGQSVLSLNNINSGDFVEVRAHQSGNGDIVASYVKRENADDEVLQGRVASFNSGIDITILGVTFTTSSSTEFQDNNETPLDSAEFYNRLSIGDLVKIKDKQIANGVADEVEFEL